MNKRVVISQFLSILFILLFIGCGKATNLSLESIKDIVVENKMPSGMKEGSGKELRRFIGINANDIEEFVYYIPNSTMSVEELLIIKVKDSNQIDSIEEALENRVDSQIKKFELYSPDNCGLLENYEIKVKDNYIFYIVSKNTEEFIDRFKSVFN